MTKVSMCNIYPKCKKMCEVLKKIQVFQNSNILCRFFSVIVIRRYNCGDSDSPLLTGFNLQTIIMVTTAAVKRTPRMTTATLSLVTLGPPVEDASVAEPVGRKITCLVDQTTPVCHWCQQSAFSLVLLTPGHGTTPW